MLLTNVCKSNVNLKIRAEAFCDSREKTRGVCDKMLSTPTRTCRCVHKHTQLIERRCVFQNVDTNVQACRTHPCTDKAYDDRDWISAERVII